MRIFQPLSLTSALLVLGWATTAQATASAELYSSESYSFGRFEASVRFAPGSGVVGGFFLWKDGSEVPGTFWNELDFEKVGEECALDTNAFYGDPEQVHTQPAPVAADLCGEYHTYTYEWTPDYVAWLVDGTEVRRDTGETATAFAENASEGMQIRFNIWPGDASFGGVFDPASVPAHTFVDWVQYSSYNDGDFTLEWREDFDGPDFPDGWLFGSWSSPKNLSTHTPQNVGVVDGYAVLALTADDALGVDDASPNGPPPGSDAGGGDSSDSGCSLSPRGSVDGSGLGLLLGVLVSGWYRRQRRRGSRGKRVLGPR